MARNKNITRAFMETILSAATCTNFFLINIEYLTQLIIDEDYENSNELKYGILILSSAIAIADGYVHFKIYNHKRYAIQEHGASELPNLNNRWSLSEVLKKYAPQVATHKEDDMFNQLYRDTSTDLDTSLMDVRLSSEEELAAKEEKRIISSENFIWWSAALCTLSCSLDVAGVPAAVISLLRGFDVLSNSVSTAQKITETALSGVSTFLSFWNSSSVFEMAKEHLGESKDSEEHECVCD